MLALLTAAPVAGAQSTGGAGYDSSTSQKQANPRTAQAGPTATDRRRRQGPSRPPSAPPEVHAAIAAANKIVGKPYRYGGGHAKVEDSGYDCSGTISYALIGAKLLKTPLDSSSFMRWGDAGRGDWITVYTNPGHAYVVIAGLRLDTSAAGDPSGAKGPRWRPALRSSRGLPRPPPRRALGRGTRRARAEDLLALAQPVGAAQLGLALPAPLGVGLAPQRRDLRRLAVRVEARRASGRRSSCGGARACAGSRPRRGRRPPSTCATRR
jgi:hypothetical protein